MKRLFIVEAEEILRRNLAELFLEKGYEVEAASPEQASGPLGKGRFDLIIVDAGIPGASGLEVLRLARWKDEGTLALAMISSGSVDSAVEAMRWGAIDYLQKPFELEELEMKVMRAFDRQRELRQLRALKTRDLSGADAVFESPRMKEVLALARKAARTKATVLITGERGTGKELVAEVIHRESWRSEHGLVKLNCTAFPEDRLDSELFGCEPGSCPGRRQGKIGRFELADEGSLLLDEVGRLPGVIQGKLLRAIQDQEFERIGGQRTVHVDVRVIASTERNLAEAAGRGEFSADLLARISVFEIPVPPLRERRDDILALARMFLARYAREAHRRVKGFSKAAERLLLEHPWPGNVRELSTAIERSVILADGEWIGPDQISLFESRPRGGEEASDGPPIPPGLELEELERKAILQALERANWVQRRAAASLGVSSRVMNYKIKKYHFSNPRWRRHRAPAQGS